MHYPDPLLSIPPSLSDELKRQTNKLRSRIVKANYNTRFAQTASELAEFRDATSGLVDGMDDNTISEFFRRTLNFTTYSSYAPLIAKFFEKPCKASTVINLFAPGLPDYLCMSSSTSGGIGKHFPKYDCWHASPESQVTFDPLRVRTKASITSLGHEPICIEDEDGHPLTTMYLTGVSTVIARALFDLRPEEDKERMGTFLRDHVAPYAARFIGRLRSFLLIHVLFAMCARSLESMFIQYTSTFVDMMRYLDSEFDVMVDCIANGTIPDLDGIADVRQYLEMNMLPDPERAAELRSFGRPSSRQGWCGYAWPNMRSIMITASGSFATYIPLARWFLGPGIKMHARGYGTTEARIAVPYNPLQLNQYKLYSGVVLEFLDINKSDSIDSLVQLWEVEVGRRYELILTTRDGLWRYRLADMIEISGFDPTDGVPIIQFIERRNVALRFQYFMVTEAELSAAILSVATNTAVQIVGWTAMVDNRCSPSTIGFVVELTDHQTSDLLLAREYVLDELSRTHEYVIPAIELDAFRKPTIRLVKPGTFSELLQRKLDEGAGGNLAQMKVPAVLSKDADITWVLNRVMQEL